MKKIILLFLIIFSVSKSFSQTNNSEIDDTILVKPNTGKCMVYIARREASAFLIKFGIYDGDLLLGKLSSGKYIAYECDPGEHAFISKGENMFFVDANLEEGRTYVIDLKIKPGILTARASLVPLDVSHKKFDKEKEKFIKFITKKKGELLIEDDDSENKENTEETPDLDTDQGKHMKKFYEMKAKGKKMTNINPDMYFM